MKLKLQEKPENLAEVIVRLPDGEDFSTGPVGDLFRALCQGKGREPGKYARIMQLVTEHPDASEWMRYRAAIEDINGLRRDIGADISMYADELKRLILEIDAKFPHNELKFNMLAEAYYNLGIMLRAPRQYDEAARMQDLSAVWYTLADKRNRALTSLFAGQVERVTAAFYQMDKFAIIHQLEALIHGRDFILMATGEQYPSWMQQSACLHIGWAANMADLAGCSISLEPYETDLRDGEESDILEWAAHFKGFRLMREKKFDELSRLKAVDRPSSGRDNAALTLDILVALAVKELGNLDLCHNILQKVADHTGPDGGIPIAVAKELLKVI